jgi:hypothetical protein
VLSLQPAPEGMQYTSPEFMELFRILLELTKISEMTEINQSLNRALEVIRQILGTAYVCIYQADSHFPKLSKIVSLEPEACLSRINIIH